MLTFRSKWPIRGTFPKTLFIIRHGETEFNAQRVAQGWLDTYLNKQGLEQAQQVARQLSKIHLSYIFSSDLKRAYQTASIIAAEHHLPVITTPLLRERNLGKLSGEKLTENNKIVPPPVLKRNYQALEAWQKDLSLEAREDFIARVEKFLNHFLTNFPIKGKQIAIVTHGGTIGTLLQILKITKPPGWRPGNTEVIKIEFIPRDYNEKHTK